MTIVAVADTGPLIHLAEIDALDLLTAIDELLIPETVYAELEEGGVPQTVSGNESRLHNQSRAVLNWTQANEQHWR
ncbi:hypothetical protein [Haladaptatus sp. W1]|uniref:hypothetical protein n=1 Tax=Haladaptatus sp. W1 TaxID=1897478 RepID=UPI0020C7A97C|nr:hypothetical protein [Haladaptatus sp. W1]